MLGWLLIMRRDIWLVAKVCLVGALLAGLGAGAQVTSDAGARATMLHAARMLDVAAGKIVSPGEVLVEGNKIVEVGAAVTHPAGAEVIDLGDATLMPGFIDAHVHLFLHPGAEDLQTIEESVAQRTILAEIAARDDLMAGFTAERDMGTEGAGSADSAVRNRPSLEGRSFATSSRRGSRSARSPSTSLPISGCVLFTLGITGLTAILFGIAPALRATRPSMAPSLKEGRGLVSAPMRNRLGRGNGTSELPEPGRLMETNLGRSALLSCDRI